jgi:hypothetical protein
MTNMTALHTLKTNLTQAQAAEFLGVRPSCLEAWRVKGSGPPFLKLGSKLVRYRLADLERWLDKQVRMSTSDKGNGSSPSPAHGQATSRRWIKN